MKAKSDWQAWMLGALLSCLTLVSTCSAKTFADELKELKVKQEAQQKELTLRAIDIEVLKTEMKNQTELMKAMNSALQQLVERSRK